MELLGHSLAASLYYIQFLNARMYNGVRATDGRFGRKLSQRTTGVLEKGVRVAGPTVTAAGSASQDNYIA